MKIVDITPETESHYLCCLEEYSEDIKEAGPQKLKWYNHMKDKGLRVKYAIDDDGTVGGMIHYVPIEYSSFEGKNLYAVLCIWVHGHKLGRGDYRKRGMGKALLKAAEEDVKNMGSDGLVTWGLAIPVFMRASWFRKHGYKTVEKAGMMRLLWKPFNENAVPPKFMKPKKLPDKGESAVNITLFRNGWCPNFNVAAERTLKAAAEFPDKVNLQEFSGMDRNIVNEWGISEAIYIDGKELWTGPAPSIKSIRKKIEKRVKKIPKTKTSV
jgi:N-acetylglutamate synthase-like GNAT family acetyltransferase